MVPDTAAPTPEQPPRGDPRPLGARGVRGHPHRQVTGPADRARAAARHPETAGFHEVYIGADVATCERRDPKGLYTRARAGLIPEFAGISAPYEPPETPDLVIETTTAPVEQSAARLLDYIKRPPCPSGSLLVYSHAEKGRRGGTSPAVPRHLILA